MYFLSRSDGSTGKDSSAQQTCIDAASSFAAATSAQIPYHLLARNRASKLIPLRLLSKPNPLTLGSGLVLLLAPLQLRLDGCGPAANSRHPPQQRGSAGGLQSRFRPLPAGMVLRRRFYWHSGGDSKWGTHDKGGPFGAFFAYFLSRTESRPSETRFPLRKRFFPPAGGNPPGGDFLIAQKVTKDAHRHRRFLCTSFPGLTEV